MLSSAEKIKYPIATSLSFVSSFQAYLAIMAPGRWGAVPREAHYLGNMQDVGGEFKDNHSALGQEHEDGTSLQSLQNPHVLLSWCTALRQSRSVGHVGVG